MVSKDSYKEVTIKNVFLVEAPINQAFPLICPVMEYKWINGWKCNLIHFPNGKMGNNCVFTEFMSAPFLIGNILGKTKWTTEFYDPKCHQVHFRLDNNISSSLYKIEMLAETDNTTKCSLELTYNPVNSRGYKFIAGIGENRIKFLLSALGYMLKHYCETGTIYSSTNNGRHLVYLKDFSKSEKIRLILNKLFLYLYTDHHKKTFLAGKSVEVRESKQVI